MKLTQNQLAAGLGISQANVSKLVRLGMPQHSIPAARAWRENNLDPARAKPAPPAPSLSPLLEEAEALLDMGGDPAPLLPDLRRALRQVPADQRATVGMAEYAASSVSSIGRSASCTGGAEGPEGARSPRVYNPPP